MTHEGGSFPKQVAMCIFCYIQCMSHGLPESTDTLILLICKTLSILWLGCIDKFCWVLGMCSLSPNKACQKRLFHGESFLRQVVSSKYSTPASCFVCGNASHQFDIPDKYLQLFLSHLI